MNITRNVTIRKSKSYRPNTDQNEQSNAKKEMNNIIYIAFHVR